MRRLPITKLLRGFNGAKEPVAMGGITTYPTGTGSAPAVESDLSSFDADKKIPSKAGGVGRRGASADGPFAPTPCRQSRVAPNGSGKSKQAVPRGGDNVLLQSRGAGAFFLFLVWFF